MYKVRFDFQYRDGYPDEEHDSIVLTDETYAALPVLSYDETFDAACVFLNVPFAEQVRHIQKVFPGICVMNNKWHHEDETLVNRAIVWRFVCLDKAKEMWIAFKYWDATPISEAYGSTVNVKFPCHGEVYRLDEKCMAVVDKLAWF